MPDASVGDVTVRDLLSSLRALQVLSMVMTETGGEDEILKLAISAVPSLSHCRAEALWLDGDWRMEDTLSRPVGAARDLAAQIAALGACGGRVRVSGLAWAWALPVSSRGGASGYLVVGAPTPRPDYELSLLQALAQQTGVALANARLHAEQRATTSELRVALAALRRNLDIHSRLTRVGAAGEGLEGIAQAVHELTGFPVAIEDRVGNLQVWVGQGRPDPYPGTSSAGRDRLLSQALAAGGPIRHRDRLLIVAHPREDILAVLALVDPDGSAGEAERMALEHGGTVLAMELTRLRTLAETELRLGRDLLEELLAGTDAPSALKRARALGYDLERVHRVVVVEGTGRTLDDEQFFHAIRRAARDNGIGSLLVARAGAVVVLAYADRGWEPFRASILADIARGSCRVGVGGCCISPADFPRSYREAQLALKTQQSARSDGGVAVFDDLGAYRVLSQLQDDAVVESFVQEWLGALIDHDERKHAQLVATLSAYVEGGGSYDSATKTLAVHRSTLRYRLERIREVSGHDLSDPDIRFNLQLATRVWSTLRAMRAQ